MLVRGAVGLAQPQNDVASPQSLSAAIEAGDTNLLRSLYLKNTNAFSDDYGNGGYFHPLLRAVENGRADMVAQLLSYGADPNVFGDTSRSFGGQLTPLEVSAQRGFLEICGLLLKAGADPNHHSASGETALHFAFNEFYGPLTNQDEIGGLLLDYGADPFSTAGYYQQTPFELAITKGDGRLIPQMLGQDAQHPLGAKSLFKPRHRRPPVGGRETSEKFLARRGGDLLRTAVQRGELEAVDALIRAGVNVKDAGTNSPSLIETYALAANAAWQRRTEEVRQWRQSQQFEHPYYNGQADQENDQWLRDQENRLRDEFLKRESQRWEKMRELLVRHGADYDAFAATILNDTNQINRLVSADKNVALAHDGGGETVLHWAVRAGRLPLASFWLANGTLLNATNRQGQTALQLAAATGRADFVSRLMAAGADTSIKDTNGRSALDAAIQAQQPECIRLLLPQQLSTHAERGIAQPLHEAAAAGNMAGLAALLETETNLEVRNELGLTPLQVAVLNGHLAAAATLAEKGADINARAPDGNSLLFQTMSQAFSLYIRDYPPADWLGRAAGDPRKAAGAKYLMTGDQRESGQRNLVGTVAFLLACGIDLQSTNHAGQTPIQFVLDEKTPFFEQRESVLKLLAEAGGRVDQRDADGNTALHRAAHAVDGSQLDALTALIAAGADVNATNAAGRTPLQLAAEKIWGWGDDSDQSSEPFQSLVRAGANVNAQDGAGLTPLHILALADTSFKQEATRLLLAKGANPNLRDRQGRTPAHCFLSGPWPWNEAVDCLAMLSKAGADLGARDDEGKTPLHYLAALGTQSPLFFLRGVDAIFIGAKVDFNAQDKAGDTPLHIAARTGTRDVFDWLVKQGARLDETNNAGETPRLLAAHQSGAFPQFGSSSANPDVFTAARAGNLADLAALLKADPGLAGATNQFGQSPLLLAINSHQTNAVDFLDQHGAQWDVVTAVRAGRAQILSAILARQPGAVTNRSSGGSLLDLAAANGDVASAKILINAGADLRAGDSRGLSPLGVARLYHHPELAQVLRQQGATENIFDVAYNGGADAAASLLRQNPSLAGAVNDLGMPVAAVAAGCGQAEVLKLLLAKGADANGKVARSDQTPLHLAAIYNQTNTARLLLRAGAEVDAFDAAGQTPLHLAALGGKTEVARLLLQHHAGLNLPTDEPANGRLPGMPFMGGPGRILLTHETALHLAALAGQTNLIRLLLASGAPVNATDGTGRTPLDLARQAGEPQNMFWMQMHARREDPLGFGMAPPFHHGPGYWDQLKEVVSLLQAAGGKHGRPEPNQFPAPGAPW